MSEEDHALKIITTLQQATGPEHAAQVLSCFLRKFKCKVFISNTLEESVNDYDSVLKYENKVLKKATIIHNNIIAVNYKYSAFRSKRWKELRGRRHLSETTTAC